MNRDNQQQGNLGNGKYPGTQEGFAPEEIFDKPEIAALSDGDKNFDPDWENDPSPGRPPRVPKLVKDTFIEKFIYLQGLTPTPRIYFRFVALSLLSAVLQNKVYVEMAPGSRLYPNLFVFLIGPSGIGKGRAIAAGTNLLEASGFMDYCGFIGGSYTSAALIDFLASKAGIGIPGTSRAYIVSPELASSIKWGDHADALIKRMTDFYTGDLAVYMDMTRARGMKKVGRPCISWLAASTRNWLIANLKSDVLAGGFMARGLFVEEFAKTPGVKRTIAPPDSEEVFASLRSQLASEIPQLSGKFILSAKAQLCLEEWHEEREEPSSEAAQASWNRHEELGLKVALLLCAAEPKTNQIITDDHLYAAFSLVEEIKATESTLWSFIVKGGKMSDVDYIAKKIKRKGTIDHSVLVSQAATSGRGIMGKRLVEILIALEESGKIKTERRDRKGSEQTKTGKVVYTWAEGRPSLLTTEEEE